MGLNEKDKLSDDVLMSVAGGATDTEYIETKRREFDAAWISAEMESKGVSGMRRPQIYEAWVKSGYKVSAGEYLANPVNLGMC